MEGGIFNIMQMRAKIYAQNCVQRKIYEVSVARLDIKSRMSLL